MCPALGGVLPIYKGMIFLAVLGFTMGNSDFDVMSP